MHSQNVFIIQVGQETVLKLIPCPTPRWPDLLVAYSPSDRLVFTSKLFSAHVRCTFTPLSLSAVQQLQSLDGMHARHRELQ